MWDFFCIFAPDFMDDRLLSEDKQQGKQRALPGNPRPYLLMNTCN